MYRGKCLFVIGAALLLILAAGCSDDKGTNGGNDTAEGTIGPEGGTVAITGEITLAVPPSALSETVDFTIQENSSPTPIGGTMRFVSPVYSVGPTGTQFNTGASITIAYNPSLIGGGEEEDISIYTNDGTGWEEIATVLYTNENLAMTGVTHLSEFGAAVDTSTAPAEGIFAAMAIGRTITMLAEEPFRVDVITARFDSSYSPCIPVTPAQAAAVDCNEYSLTWVSETSSFQYYNAMELDFIELGEQYIFNVTGNAEVPSFVDTIDFPVDETYVTDPATNDIESLSGFNVAWENGTGSGTVYLILMEGGTTSADTAIFVETANDGSYTFNESALQTLTPGTYGLIMVHENWLYIDNVEGVDPRSFTRARIINTTQITLQQ